MTVCEWWWSGIGSSPRQRISIHGDVEGHGRPKAGATEPFDLSIVTTLADRPGANHAILRVIEWSDECARG